MTRQAGSSTGKVTRLVNWRDNNPVIWRREP
jgi:hypothetical protein